MAQRFYKRKQWANKRKIILKRDEHLCQECKRYGKSTEATTVHHIIPVEEDFSKRLENQNMISLCEACHNKMHARGTGELTDMGIELKHRKCNTPPPAK